jgi:hypothetical protein
MSKRKTMRFFATTLAVGAVVVMATHAQQGPTTPSFRAPALTAADYIEIQQLVARYAYALDTQGGSGSAYADLFTPDGAFGATKGREQLAALARTAQPQRTGPSYTRSFLTNVMINPAPEGATGSQYYVAIDVGEGGKSSTLVEGGRFDDVYVKTADGWRFKSRTLTASKTGRSREQ